MSLISVFGLNGARKSQGKGEGKTDQVNKNDDTETTSEKLIPGFEPIERIRWILEQSNAALIVPALAAIGRLVYVLSPIQHVHLLVWIVLLIYLLWNGIERLNALPFALTWSVFSSFLFLMIGGFGLAVLFGML